ncbi:GGDEF domain-containing protein [Alginatibacterium sediminis]|uniref:GGDEF domain-containing protein n=1 Tax=Alginatibacterium sediminis TaxID=2164068 RepID=A0A420EGY3_9ALTE|nr:GGDEF domain-containing protein [Alginatibacterium sediminis]RKF19924.1 GGDEF domain-containing protein [Alginatibacterium sediminis]
MRRTIALICDDIASIAILAFYRELKQQAIVQNCRILTYIGRESNSPYASESFHNTIFDHIDDSNFDAAIVVGAAFTNWHDKQQAETYIRSLSKKPIVVTSYSMSDLSCITIDNYQPMFDLTCHLHQVHGHESIGFVTGPILNQESQQRLQAYKDALKDLGLHFDPSYVFEGDYRPESGKLAIQFFQKLGKSPSAIMFANDDMAVAALDYIQCHVPWMQNRWAITGFDDQILAHSAQLTTVSHPFASIARTAIQQLLSELEQPNAKQNIVIPSELVFRNSCGCEPHIQTKLPNFSIYNATRQIHENIQSFDLEVFYQKLAMFLKHYHVRGCYITQYVQESPTQHLKYARLLFAYQNYQIIPVDTQQIFECKQLLPNEMLKQLNYDVLAIQSLFFDKTHFGYLILDISDGAEEALDILRGHISHSIMGAHLIAQRDSAQQRLEKLTQQLKDQSQYLLEQSSKDTLTGVLNRRGAHALWAERLDQLTEQSYVDVYCADLNGLKAINDNHGHSAGDKAIQCIAEILEQIVSDTALVSRQGGDEFLIVEFEASENASHLLMNKFRRLIQMRNCELTMPFFLDAEIGHHRSNKLASFDELVALADQQLYLHKRLTKERLQGDF